MGRGFALALVLLSACAKQVAKPPAEHDAGAKSAPRAESNELSLEVCRDERGALRREVTGTLHLSPEDATKRYGHDVTRYSATRTTLEHTIQLCGADQERQWLMYSACDDGSHPIDSMKALRTAFKGPEVGGLCQAHVSHYIVPCPERRYDVFIDDRFCARDEQPTDLMTKRACIVARDPAQNNAMVNCVTGSIVNLEGNRRCHPKLLQSRKGVQLCLVGLKALKASNLGCRVERRCGQIWNIGCNHGSEPSTEYVDGRSLKVLATWGMSDCPVCERISHSCTYGNEPGRKHWEDQERTLWQLYRAQPGAEPDNE